MMMNIGFLKSGMALELLISKEVVNLSMMKGLIASCPTCLSVLYF